MAKLSAHGKEVIRYISPKYHGLISVRSDGTVLRRTPWSGWKLFGKIKPGIDKAEWIRKRVEWYQNSAPEWMRQTSLPSEATLLEWQADGVAETPSGYSVEPDGRGPDGSPSWFLVLGLI